MYPQPNVKPNPVRAIGAKVYMYPYLIIEWEPIDSGVGPLRAGPIGGVSGVG